MRPMPVGRGGFSLIEVLAVIAGLGLLMILSAVVLVSVFRINDTARDVQERRGQRSLLADQFRADVAQAADAPARLGDVAAGADCLLLRKPDGKHVAYRAVAGQLERCEPEPARGIWKWIPLDPVGVAAEFRRSGPDGRLVTLRVTQTAGRGASKRPLDITAALGGDLR